ncbi:MAG TPA: two-component regulator propeller domain-containing protein [Anditalea sp.]|nr:two-component regulator propeller domain-containing protein [Anditalea sp.]
MKNYLLHHLLFLPIILTVLPINSFGNNSPFYFKNIGVENGLSHQTVYSILQDKQGFMWFGTKDGLNRFDGKNFKIFRNDVTIPHSLGNNTVWSMFEDSDSNIWVGTNQGVYIYDPRKEEFRHFEISDKAGNMVSGAILDIIEDLDGNIWMASSTTGLYHFDISNNTLIHYFHIPDDPSSLAYGSISSLTIDNQGFVWVSILGSGVQKFIPANATFEDYGGDSKEMNKDLIFELFDHGQDLLIGTKNSGLKKLNKSSKTIENILVKDSKNNPLFIRCLINDNKNQLWIGTELGIYLYNPLTQDYRHIQHNPDDPYSIIDNAIYSIFQDREGGIWVGTYFGGLAYLPNESMLFEKYYPIASENSISGRRVREMVEDDKGNIWIGTEDAGLNKFDPKKRKFTHFDSGNGTNKLNYHNIHGLLKTNNKLWISSHSMNLKLDVMNLDNFEISKLNQTHLQNPLYDSDIFSIYEDKIGRIWIGTISGAYLVKPDGQTFEFIEDIGIPFIYDITEDHEGNIWFATTNSGLIKYKPDTGKNVNYLHEKSNLNSLPSNNIICLTLDKKNRLWIGTEGGGLAVYNSSSDDFTSFRADKGLPSNIVYKIIEDDLQHLWLSTSNGLVQFNPQTEKMKVFSKATGLLSDQFNYKSGIKSQDGTLYFGTLNGFISFDPKTFTESKFTPPVVITGIKLFNKDIEIGKENSPLATSVTNAKSINLDHDQNALSFSFAALGYTAMESWEYAYMMEGFDKKWNTLLQNQEVSYSNLPPGEYRFRVKTLKGIEAGDPSEANLLVTINPPFYLSNLAYFLYAILILTLLYIIFHLYKKRMHAKHQENLNQLENEKEREIYHAKIEFFTNITHEIRTPLTLIRGPLEEIIKNREEFTEEVQENLMVMERNSTRLINLSNQLLDFRKTEQKVFSLSYVKTDIVLLLNDLHYRFKSTAIQKNLQFIFDTSNDAVYADVDREALTKVLSNLFSNALKNAESIVKIILKKSTGITDKLELSVFNDGHLIEPQFAEKIFEPFYQIRETGSHKSKEGTGLGLPLARSLVELHGGTLTYQQTKEGVGNYFVVVLPVKQINTVALSDETLLDSPIEINEISVANTPNEDHTKPSILIVEDNKEMQSFITSSLKKEYHIYKADNGEEAMKVLDVKPIDIIISDIMMPIMNGYELCKEVKAKLEYSHIPVILLTAKQSLKSKIEGLEMGADVYIEKPFSIDYVSLQIKNLLHYRDQVRHSFANSPLVLAETIAHTRADEQFLSKINLLILENLSNEIFGVNELAEAVNMSQSSLLRKIKGISKLTPNEYIRLVRLKKSAEILNEGKYTISEVCSMVGFNSPSYFSKCFFKQFGELPKDFHKTETSST